jgi:protein-tyrosine phosphatase
MRSRRIELSGAVNFRDIGGYPAGPGRRVRWSTVFRSDDLGGLTDADIELVDALGIRTLIDFRVPFERTRKPNRLPVDRVIESVELGFVPSGGIEMLRGIAEGVLDAEDVRQMVITQYRSFVTEGQTQYRTAFGVIADAERFPLLIHCTSGKDRTGFAIAVLLATLGVPRETVVRDFLLTNDYRRDLSVLFSESTRAGVPEMLTSARPEYIEAAFAQIDESYGGLERYLAEALGIDAVARERLIERLTEPEE